MLVSLPLRTMVVGVLCGIAATISVAVSVHWWRLPLQTWLPGASLLFFPPYAIAAFVFAFFLASRFWRSAKLQTRLFAAVAALCGPFIGILLALPGVCAIARECL